MVRFPAYKWGVNLETNRTIQKTQVATRKNWGLVTSRCLSADDEKDAVEVVGGQRALCCPY